MYIPARFAETRPEVLHTLLDTYPLGTLVRAGPAGLDADHLPFDRRPPGPEAPHGLLRAHVARANPLARTADGMPVMVVFRGASGYVSPRAYDLQALGGREVPTWNYDVVHVHGRLRTVDDKEWLLAHMRAATARHEGVHGGWTMDDAPRDFIDKLVRATVGIEIAIERIEGKFKRG
jgi:transcriptional regulator